MVHRAPDSRLLTNLINHEKEYAKHLTALFPLSHAALAALSAYAAASPSSHPASPAHTIAAIVDILASADDALQRYTRAIETWREQLVALKDLEDDLAAVLRDRDILVTRLLKASKSTRDAHRSSRLVAPLPSLGSASLSSLPSTNSTSVSLSAHSPASTNAKLAHAQAELQACEAHLASKERELDAHRITIARDGLGARCRALVDCGWIWGEMGKQALKVLQALGADGSSGSSNLSAPKPSPPVPSHLSASTNPTTYASDNSSLTPSQSASQTARSAETSHEGPTSKEHEHIQSGAQLETTAKPPTRSTRASDDLTITLPPAHAVSDLALPTGIPTHRPSLENGDRSPATRAGAQPAPALTRKRTKRPRRPPSQHITEASDDDSDRPSSTSNHNVSVNVSTSPRVSHTPFPTTRVSGNDTSSDDEHPTGPLQVVENDPFEVIRRSMLGPTAASASPLLVATAPTARASAPDVRTSAVYDISPSEVMFPASVSGHGQRGGIGMGSPPSTVSASPKRQRRTSKLFFGSLRGLFRKPKERLGAVWDEGHSSPSPSSPNLTRAKTSGGWVTRTDARIKGRSGGDSDEEAMPKRIESKTTTTNGANVGRSASGARLRKGRRGASMRENGTLYDPSHRAGMDGWITDNPGGTGAGAGAGVGTGTGTGLGRSQTRRGTIKRKKMSVADLRGSDQGHTDGEIDGARQSLECVSSKGRVKAPEASVSKPVVVIKEEKALAAPTGNPVADPNGNISPGTQTRRVTTTATSSRRLSSDAAPAHRRSASLSLVDANVMSVVSMSMRAMHASTSTGGNMSWRKPPPQIEPPPQPASPSPAPSQSLTRSPSQVQVQSSSRVHESQPKPNARRHLGNGHAKHVQNQSLMSIVADVTRQNLGEDWALVTDKAKSFDIPRAPGSVWRDGGVGSVERGENIEGGHGRTMSEDRRGRDGGSGQRETKVPLKSALRNPSRTPSPVAMTVPATVPAGEVRWEKVEEERGRDVSLPWRDSASISSYETGRESLDGEEQEPSSPLHSQSRSPVVRSRSQPLAARRSHSTVLHARSHARSPSPPPLSFTFPPPPVDPPPASVHAPNANPNANSNPVSIPNENGNGNAVEPPSSSVSTETPPVRRKSVRMSLQPTYSPTPPALRDEDSDGEGGGDRYAPWNGREPPQTKTSKGSGDVWADSSEEDEMYSRARRLLSLTGRGRT